MTDPRIIGSMQLQTRALERIAKALEAPAIDRNLEEMAVRFAHALLDLVEIEGSECAHGYGPAARCPEPDCAWHPLRPIMVEASRVAGRGLVDGSMDRELARPDARDSAGGLDA